MVRNKEKYRFYKEMMDATIDTNNRDYTVAGEVLIDGEDEGEIVKRVYWEERDIYVQPVGTYRENKYKTLGYILCEGNEWIAVKKKKQTRVIAGILLAAALVAGLAGGILLMRQKKELDIDPNAASYTSELKRPDNIDDSRILIPGYGTFTIEKGSDTLNTVLFNPEDNPCFFKFTLVEKETGEILYESKLVPPGQGISPVKMTKTFEEAGVYEATLKFQTVDLEDPDITYNGSEFEVNIKVVE
jgi:hypothetical protein